MAYSAAAMYGAAAFVGAVEGLLPGGERFSPLPGVIAFLVVTALVLWGRRLPMAVLAALGPIGAVLIGVAIATTNGHGTPRRSTPGRSSGRRTSSAAAARS